jgi:predicted nucleic acid-binding protein
MASRISRVLPLYVAEPPASFMVRPPLVVDCSVLSAVLFEEPMRDEALRQMAGRTMHAPSLLDHEIANVATKKMCQKWPADSVDMALADYAEQDIALHRVDVAQQVALALRYGLSAYDAAYLWLAAELKAPLATFDRKLGTAATQHLGQLE